MNVSGIVPIFALAFVGGLLAEALKWYSLRESEQLPHYARSPFYWGVTLVLALAGGLLAVLYGTEPRNAILIVNIGASAPLVIKSLASTTPAPPQGGAATGSGYSMSAGGARPSLLGFLSGR